MAINNPIIQAELLKLKAETEKLQLEADAIKISKARRFWQKASFWQNFFGALAGVTVIYFYFETVALPMFQKDNIELGLINAQKEDSLSRVKKELDAFHVKLDYQSIKNHQDSVTNKNLTDSLLRLQAIIFAFQDSLIAIKNSNSGKDLTIKRLNSKTGELIDSMRQHNKFLMGHPVTFHILTPDKEINNYSGLIIIDNSLGNLHYKQEKFEGRDFTWQIREGKYTFNAELTYKKGDITWNYRGKCEISVTNKKFQEIDIILNNPPTMQMN